MFHQLNSKSKDLDDMLKVLPGVVVLLELSMQGLADLYRIKPNLLEHPESTIGPILKSTYPGYMLDDYLSGFLQDQDRVRSQLYYCDPMLQHISICRHFFSLMDASRSFHCS